MEGKSYAFTKTGKNNGNSAQGRASVADRDENADRADASHRR